MKLSEFTLELICLLVFTLCSSLWVMSLKEDKATTEKISPLLALEKLVPQHKIQLLNANFGDQQHYDQLAQLQSELESLVYEVNVSDESEKLFTEYKEASLSYIQLTSMLKTSQRLISDNSQIGSSLLLQEIEKIRLGVFSYISTPNKTDKASLIEQINSINIDSSRQTNWRHLQLVKLHSLFVLDNLALNASHRQKLLEMPIIETISQERVPLQHQITRSNIKQYAGIVGSILGLAMLCFVVFKRHGDALKKASEQHKEFASSIIDMLDAHADVVEANPALKGSGKPLRIKKS